MLLQLYSVTAVTQCYFCSAALLQLYSVTLVFQCYWNSNILTNPSDSETALLLCNETHRVDDYTLSVGNIYGSDKDHCQKT